MTLESYVQLHTMCMIVEQVILVTLFCEIIVALWHDENAKIGAFLCEMSLCGVYFTTDVASVMGPVMTGIITLMISLAIIKVAMTLPAIIRYRRLVSRCKRACRQNQRVLSADEVCKICQAYCRQVRQRVK